MSGKIRYILGGIGISIFALGALMLSCVPRGNVDVLKLIVWNIGAELYAIILVLFIIGGLVLFLFMCGTCDEPGDY